MKKFPGKEIYSLGNCLLIVISAEDYRKEYNDSSDTWRWMYRHGTHLEMGSKDAYIMAINRMTDDVLQVWRGTTKSPLPTKRRWWQRWLEFWKGRTLTIEEAIDRGRQLIEAQNAISDEMSLRIEAKMEELALRREAMRELDTPQIAPTLPAVANGGGSQELLADSNEASTPHSRAKQHLLKA